jgi:hypothetical protein
MSRRSHKLNKSMYRTNVIIRFNILRHIQQLGNIALHQLGEMDMFIHAIVKVNNK